MIGGLSHFDILSDIALIGEVSDGNINISIAESLSCYDFDFYLAFYRELYERKQKDRQKEEEDRQKLQVALFTELIKAYVKR